MENWNIRAKVEEISSKCFPISVEICIRQGIFIVLKTFPICVSTENNEHSHSHQLLFASLFKCRDPIVLKWQGSHFLHVCEIKTRFLFNLDIQQAMNIKQFHHACPKESEVSISINFFLAIKVNLKIYYWETIISKLRAGGDWLEKWDEWFDSYPCFKAPFVKCDWPQRLISWNFLPSSSSLSASSMSCSKYLLK